MFKAAKNRVVNGLNQLKIAYTKYSATPTPNTPDWYAPQVFQGIKTEVTVPESSKVLLKFSGARPLSSYAFLNILPGITNAKYWSDAIAFSPKQLITVLANKPNTVVASFNNS